MEEKLGGLQFFCWMEYQGALKCQGMTLGDGGVFKFLLSSILTEQHDA